MSDAQVLRSVIFEVIENQLRDRALPETKEAYDRLLAGEYSKEQVMEYIGCAASSEVFSVV